MSSRRVKIVLLCEDSQQEAFARRFLNDMGWNVREIRVEKSPSAVGSAEQWVRKRFPLELKTYRKRQAKALSGLIVMIDADSKEIVDRISEFEIECLDKNVPFRSAEEAVAIAIPKRNIETWIHYLNGTHVDEVTTYRKLERERMCQPAVSELVRLCKTTGLTIDAPNSLHETCNEYSNKIKHLKLSV